MNQTKSGYTQAVLAGAFIRAFLTHLDKHDYNRLGVIRLRQHLSGILKKAPNELAGVAVEAYEELASKYKDEQIQLDLGILIEAIAFNKQETMEDLFGSQVITLIERASAKITLDGLTTKQRKDSYRVADEVKEAIERHTFNYIRS